MRAAACAQPDGLTGGGRAVWAGSLPDMIEVIGTGATAAVAFGVAGLAAGWLAARAVRRLPGLAAVRAGRCAVLVGACWAVAGAEVAAGGLAPRWAAVVLLLACAGVPLAAADLVRFRLPDAVVLPGFPVLGGLVLAGSPAAGWIRVPAGVLLLGGLHLLVRLIAPAAMGAGDVKLAGVLGAPLGAVGWPALLLAPVLAAVVTAGLAAARRRRVVPHGPGLLVAAWVLTAVPGGVLAGAG